jgi:hypothetical protein
MQQREHWWTRWGKLACRDILIFDRADTWRVEARDGGADGRSRFAKRAAVVLSGQIARIGLARAAARSPRRGERGR